MYFERLNKDIINILINSKVNKLKPIYVYSALVLKVRNAILIVIIIGSLVVTFEKFTVKTVLMANYQYMRL